MDWTMWTDEASGVYIWYSSIGKNRTSFRRNFGAKLLYFITLIINASPFSFNAILITLSLA